MYFFLPVLIFKFCIKTFWLLVTVALYMCWFLKAITFPVFISINYCNLIPYGQMVSFFFPYMVCHIRLFNFTSYHCFPRFYKHYYMWAAFLVLCILYHNCQGWSAYSSWSCWILSVAWHGRDSSGELSHLWILSWCHLDYIYFGSFRLGLLYGADTLCWVFGYRLLSSNPCLELMLCALGRFYDRVYVFKLIISSWYASISLLIAFAWCCKQWNIIPFFTLYGWWEFKLRYCPMIVGLFVHLPRQEDLEKLLDHVNTIRPYI